jgi:hypothetical protein
MDLEEGRIDFVWSATSFKINTTLAARSLSLLVCHSHQAVRIVRASSLHRCKFISLHLLLVDQYCPT